MAFKIFTGALLSGAIVAFAPAASAQVESSPMIEESQSPVATVAPTAREPRNDSTMFGLGVAATVTGGIAVPTGGFLLLLDVVRGVGEGFDCAARLGEQCRSSSDAMATVGAVVLVSGVVLLAAGIPMIVVGGKRQSKRAALDPFVIRF